MKIFFFVTMKLIFLLTLTFFIITLSPLAASGKNSRETEALKIRNNSYFTENLYYDYLEREKTEEKRNLLSFNNEKSLSKKEINPELYTKKRPDINKENNISKNLLVGRKEIYKEIIKRETLKRELSIERNESEGNSSNQEELKEERENADSEDVNRSEERIKELPLFTLARTIGLEEFQVEGGFTFTTYKDDRPSKIASPFLLRIPLAERWEFRLSGDFLEFQSPYLDIDDATIGLTWLFRKNNPSLALRTTLKLPTGTPRVTDDAFLPGVHFSIDWRINEIWDISANLGWSAKNSGETSQYKDQKNKLKLGYRIDDKNYIYCLIAKEFPDNSDRDYSLISGGIGYKKALTDKTQIIIEAIKFFSEGDKDWVIGISIGQSY